MDKDGKCIIEKEAEHMKVHGSLGEGHGRADWVMWEKPLKSEGEDVSLEKLSMQLQQMSTP